MAMENEAAPEKTVQRETAAPPVVGPAAPTPATAPDAIAMARKANQLALAAFVLAASALILTVLTVMARARMAIHRGLPRIAQPARGYVGSTIRSNAREQR